MEIKICPKFEEMGDAMSCATVCQEVQKQYLESQKCDIYTCSVMLGTLINKSEPGCPDTVPKCPQVDGPSVLEINTSRTYLTSSKCWESTFDGQFFWRKGLDKPKNWAPDEPISIACQGMPCTPAGEYRHSDMLPGTQTKIFDFRLFRWRYETSCGIRSFFVNTKDRDACLQDKTILIVGDSTIRQVFRLLT